MHYYQHHIGDFIKATARLSDSQTMAYLRLLWMYYDNEKPLKPDSKLLAFQIGSTPEDVDLLLNSFFVLTDSGWHQTRCDEEIADYHNYKGQKSNAGKISAARRKNNSSAGVEQVFNDSSTDVQLTTNHKPLTNNHKPRVKNKDSPASVTDSRIDEIKKVFPKRGGSHKWGDAERAYNARLAEGHTHEEMLAGCERYARFLSITGKVGTEFVQMAATFLGRNKGFLEPWTPPAEVKDVRQLSAVERVRLACNTERGNYDERVVSEQSGSVFGSLDILMRDVRK